MTRVPPGDIVVLDRRARPVARALARLALGLAPDVLHALEQARARRGSASPAASGLARAQVSGVRLSEVEYDLKLPFVRRVVVRSASAWAGDLPAFAEPREPKASSLRRAGLAGLGGAAAVALASLLVNRLALGRGRRRP